MLDAKRKQTLGGRELVYGVVGVLLGLLILSGVWLLTGRSATRSVNITEVTPYAAPNFTLQDLGGRPVSLSDFRGKVVLLNFWGTWCEPCKEETPALEATYRQLKDEGLVILGIDQLNGERSLNRDVEDVQRFAALYDVTYPILLDEQGTVGQSYSIVPLPTSIFVDRQGQVRYIRIGPLNSNDIERIFRRLDTPGAQADLQGAVHEPAADRSRG